jgi:hypothetical protein
MMKVMAKFNGTNNLKTTRLAFERANYRVNAFEEEDVHVYDFGFAERTFYGRVNRMLEPVIPDETHLKVVQENFRLMNFVADQFIDLEAHFAKACRMGVVPIDDPVLSSLKIKRAYETPIDNFKAHSESEMRKVIDNVMMPNMKKVENIEQFVKLFEQSYLQSDSESTFTLSDYMKSRNSNMFNSALALDIAGLDYSNDPIKEERMFNSPAFRYYLNLTRQYGFRVDENNPGVLVSDLASPATKPYRNRYLLTTIASIFDKQYNKTVLKDLSYLSNLIVNGYNNYVSKNPYNTHYKTCNNNTISSITNIKNISRIDYNIILLLYINMKNFFEGSPLSPSSRKQISQTALTIAKHDRDKALLYIEDQFKAFYNQKHGSLTYFEKRIKNT